MNITELCCKIDDALPPIPQHGQAILAISELVTVGALQAMKPVSQRAFYPWLKACPVPDTRDNYGHRFPT